MARPSKTGGKRSATTTRKASSAKGRNRGKAKRRNSSSTTRHKRPLASDLGEELKEAREQQDATARILKVIASSPDDVQPVMKAIVESACELCGAYDAVALLKEGDDLLFSAHHGPIPMLSSKRPINRRWTAGRAFIDRKAVHVDDLQAEQDEFPDGMEMARAMGHRSIISVPLLRGSESIGALVLRRIEVNPFSEKQIALLQTFADQAVIAIQNVRLFKEVQAKTHDLTEALTHQTGSANILRVIASSPTDVRPVLQAVVESACELCEAYDAIVMLKDGEELCLGAHHGPIPMNRQRWSNDRTSVSGRAMADCLPVHVKDMLSDEGAEFVTGREMSRVDGCHTLLGVPLLREGEAIGAILLRRAEVYPFSDKQIALLQTFADQAVIALGNARLFEEVQARTRDLAGSLQQQTATADVLKAISRSAFDLKTVLNALLTSACELCGADIGTIRYEDGGSYRLAATYGCKPEWIKHFSGYSTKPDQSSVFGQTIIGGRTVHMPDVLADPNYKRPEAQKLMGFRAALGVPFVRDGHTFGVINLFRSAVGSFEPKQIEIVETFADQAVIAIENVRLFEQVQARTRDLQEALTAQTGSANILRVIASSPTDVGPVLNAIVVSACELCEAYDAVLRLRDGDNLRVSAHHGPIPSSRQLWPINRNWTAGRSVLERTPVQVCDMRSSEGDEFPEGREYGLRTILTVPLLREGESIGSITLRRTEVNPFSEKQINLLQVFADQAVIAIGNVQLFEEVQQRTRELSESLEQQVATSEVLQVISSSQGELEPVFQSMLANATRLCEAECGVMWLHEGDSFRSVAIHGPLPPAYVEQWRSGTPVHPSSHSPLTVLALTRKAVHVADMREDQSYLDGDPLPVAAVEVAGIRTLLLLPMSKEEELVGGIAIYRQQVRPFTDKQVELVSTFARQAVIAIENARLLKELRQRTNDLSRSLHELGTAQDRLVQTEKLASLGQLTAGIAHEIKNPLNFVNNFASLSAELTDELNDALKQATLAAKLRAEVNELTSLLKDNLEKVVQHGKRADSIIKNMLLHSRHGGGELRSADINALVDESLNLAYHGARAENPQFNVTLRRSFDPQVGTFEVFPQEITRVLLNLISNGFYAAATRKVENEGSGFEPMISATTKAHGDHVEIRIRDNGAGIPPDVKEKIFNPFFTTKPPGEGTGLGLSMSHDIIVKQHDGTIDVDTEPGAFTEFIITLPRRRPAH